MEEYIDQISIGVSVNTFQELMAMLEKQIKAYDTLVKKCLDIIEKNKNKSEINNYRLTNFFMPIIGFMDTLKMQAQEIYNKLNEESGLDSVRTSKKRYVTNNGYLTKEMQNYKVDIVAFDKVINDSLNSYVNIAEYEEITNGFKDATKEVQANKIIFDEEPKCRR